MKQTFVYLSIISSVLFTHSINVVAQEEQVHLLKPLSPRGAYTSPSKFGERLSNFFMSKRFKQATYQRDSLQLITHDLLQNTRNLLTDKRNLEKNIQTYKTSLKDRNEELAKVQNQRDELSQNLNQLRNASSQKQQELASQLSNQATELEDREKELQKLHDKLFEREHRLRELEGIIRQQDSIVKGIKKRIEQALFQLNSPGISVEMRGGKLYVSMSDNILFESGKTSIQENGVTAIYEITQVLDSVHGIDIMVEGHTDNVPIKTKQYRDNWDLSVARATAITRLLIENGINPERITASGKAEFSPKATNQDAEGRSKNRRSEIVLVPKLDAIYELISSK